MKRLSIIEEEYRKADFDRRLCLFLDCRELREEFIKIEQEEAVLKANELKQLGAFSKIIGSLFDLFPSSLQAKLKRCCWE